MHIISILEKWATVNSHSLNYKGLEIMSALAKEAFNKLQPDTSEIYPFGIFFKKRPLSRFQLFLGGHLDTVFSKDSPFQTISYLDDQMLQGPGVADMKGGVLVMLSALLEFEKSPLSQSVGWEIFLNFDEEIGSPQSTPFLQECSQRCDCALLFEPTLPDGSFVCERKGSSNYLVVSKGREAHAGRDPKGGKSAIFPLAHFIHEIESFNSSETLINVGTVKGGTALNTIPGYAEATLNIRFKKPIEKLLIQKAAQYGLDLQLMSSRPPKLFDTKTEKFFQLLKECGRKIGQVVEWKKTGGVCDGNTFGAAGVPTIDTLGVEGTGMHTDKECVYLPSIAKKIELTVYLLYELARKQSI